MLKLEAAEWAPRRGVGIGPLDLQVQAGERIALLGVNGSGKSSLLRGLAGLAPLRRGRLIWQTAAPVLLADVPPRCSDRSPRELLADIACLYQQAIDLEAVLAVAGLSGHAELPVSRLSLGQRQRLALALAEVSGAPCLLLDEPGNGLDPDFQRAAAGRLAAAPERTLILATHVLAPWRPLLTRAWVLDAGRLVFDGPVAELPAPWREAA